MSRARTGPQARQIQLTGQPRPLVDSLRDQIRKLETVSRPDDTKTVSTGCPGLDRLLPNPSGLATGTITEWLAPTGGYGAELLSLLAAKEACAEGGALVIVDPGRGFYPPSAAAWGLNIENMIILREPSPGDADASSTSLLWAMDQALRCPAVAAVWGQLDHVNERWLRRFQLSAEQSGVMGMFVRPDRVRNQPGWSDTQWLITESPETCGNPSSPTGFPPAPQTSFRQKRKRDSARMPEPVRRAYEKVLSQNGEGDEGTPSRVRGETGVNTTTPAFDRSVVLRLLRASGGHQQVGQTVTVRIDFTTGKVQTVTPAHEQPRQEQPFKKHPVRLVSQLADPATGGRRQRA